MKKIKLAPLCLAAVMGLSITACGSKTASSMDDEVQKAGTLVVGISADYPPFESLDTNGNLVGYDVDMTNYLAQHLTTQDGQTYTVEFVQMEFSTIISALQTGQVDIGVAAFSYDPDRECLFTDDYYESAQVVCVRKDSGYTSLEDLKGKTIAAGTGTVGYSAAQEQIEDANMVTPGDYLQQFETLRVNQIDAVVCDATVAQGYVDSSDDFMILGDPLTEDNLCITVKKGNTNLQAALNTAIAEFKSSGTSDAYKETWGL
jgi:ABC-type amino acid transport substrate-binding protein